MRVTVLGSGTSVPNPDRFPAGYLVETNGRRVLVDLGPGVLRRAAACGLDLDTIDAVLLTHYHTDHCADLAALAFGLLNPRYEHRATLPILGSAGLVEMFDRLGLAWPWLERGRKFLELREIDAGEHEVLGVPLSAIRVEHTAHSLGYRISDSRGRVAAFSGDAVDCDALVDLARDADLFVCDTAFPTAAPGVGHMTPTEAGRRAQQAGAKHLVPTHFYPECIGHDLEAEARAVFDGEVTLAEDLLAFEL